MADVAPAGTSSSAPRSLRGPVLSGALGLASAGLLHLRDPHDSGSYGFCPFQSLTGVPCPGCGGLRAVNDLSHGDVVGAISSNALAVVLVVALGALWTVWFVRRVSGDRGAQLIPPSLIPLSLIQPSLAPSGPTSSGRSSSRRGALTKIAAWSVLALVVVFSVVRTTPWGSWLAP